MLNDDVISNLASVVNALGTIEVHGENNLRNLLGCISILKDIIIKNNSKED